MGILGVFRRIQALAEWEAGAVAIMVLQIGTGMAEKLKKWMMDWKCCCSQQVSLACLEPGGQAPGNSLLVEGEVHPCPTALTPQQGSHT